MMKKMKFNKKKHKNKNNKRNLQYKIVKLNLLYSLCSSGLILKNKHSNNMSFYK